MNDFFDSLKDIKKELEKEQKIAPKTGDASSKQNLIARKQERLKAEFLDYVKNSDIRKI
jgi:hypothetical protein